MWATKLPFCDGGITHPFRCQGLSSFFLKPDVPSRVTGLVHSMAAIARHRLVRAGEREHPGVGLVSELRGDKPESLVAVQALLLLIEELSVVDVPVAALAGVLLSQIMTRGRVMVATVERKLPWMALVTGHP